MLHHTALPSEAFACSRMPSLSPFPFIHTEAEHNKAPVVWACSPECPLSRTLTSCPFIPPSLLLRDAAPREIREGLMGSGHRGKMMYCPEVLCAHVRALLSQGSLDGSYLGFLFFPCEVSFPGNTALSLRLCSVGPNKKPGAWSSALPVKLFEGISGF